MEEIEFSQRMVKVLNEKTLQDTLKKAGAQGFTVPGFSKKFYQAPLITLIGAMKIRKRGKGFQSGIFLECLSELDENILESILTKKWLMGGDARNEAESELKNIEVSILEKQKKNESIQDVFEVESNIKEDNKENNTEVIKKQKERIKKLQTIIQNYKIINDNYKKEIEQLKKENNKLELKNAEILKDRVLNEEIIEKLKVEIEKQKQQNVEMRNEIESYKNIHENAPRILCFSKKEIEREMFPFYNIECISQWNKDYIKIIDWIKYYEIWIAENDFSYSETKTIKSAAKGKVITARNFNMLITKVGGNN